MASRPPGSPRSTAIALRQSLSRLGRGLRSALPPVEATPSQLSVLGQLFRQGDLSPSELALREGVRLQSLTRLLAAIEAAGWVTRRADGADARRSVLRLTAAGASLLAAHVHQREASLEAAIAGQLSAREQQTLLAACALMDRLAAQLQPGPPASPQRAARAA